MSPRKFWIIMALVCAAVGAALAVQMRRAQLAVFADAAPREDSVPPGRTPIPDAAQTLRALKLVTVEIRTSTVSVSADDSWRGDVSASVRAPVTYYYGVDLSRLDERSIRRNPATDDITVCVPRPVRLATEILGADEETSVQVTGTRLREVSGEYHLGLARARLYDRARRAPLSQTDRVRMEDATKAQLVVLVRSITGAGGAVVIEYGAAGGVANADAPIPTGEHK